MKTATLPKQGKKLQGHDLEVAQTGVARCCYCREEVLGERMVIRAGSLVLLLHFWCARGLSMDLKRSFDSWYADKYFQLFLEPFTGATK